MEQIKEYGIIRQVDNLGRIVIPVEIRKYLGIYKNCKCVMIPTENGFYVKKIEMNLQKDVDSLIDKYSDEPELVDILNELRKIEKELNKYKKYKPDKFSGAEYI